MSERESTADSADQANAHGSTIVHLQKNEKRFEHAKALFEYVYTTSTNHHRRCSVVSASRSFWQVGHQPDYLLGSAEA